MASVRDTVLKMLTEYPLIFTDKSDCFRHLFLTNGNGYDWENGELVSWSAKTGPDFKDEDKAVQEQLEENGTIPDYEKVFGHEQYSYVRLQVRRNNIAIQFAIDNIDLIMEAEHLSFGSRNLHYSGWEYNMMTRMPDDIKDDWREAIRQVMFALTPYINGVMEWSQREIDSTKELARDLRRLKEEKFPEVIRSDAGMQKLITKILGEEKS